MALHKKKNGERRRLNRKNEKKEENFLQKPEIEN